MSIRLMVVDDSAFMRRVIISTLEEDPEIEIVGYARNGIDALEKIDRLKPDIITLDVEMPQMDGLETLRRIMADKPIPVVMISTHTVAGARQTMAALELGAVDFIAKPEGKEGIESLKAELPKIIKIAAAVRLKKPKTRPRKDRKPPDQKPADILHSPKIMAIGSSTGGPPALQALLTKLPADFPIAVVIAQHMPKGFTGQFAVRLNELCALEVKEAVDGDRVQVGRILIAPAGYQMRFRRQGGIVTVQISSRAPKGNLYKPSVDIMFDSLADIYAGNTLALILTGMGSDGTMGAKKLKQRNATILAQDKDSCVVYGMPRSAVEAGVVDRIVPLSEMASVVMQITKTKTIPPSSS